MLRLLQLSDIHFSDALRDLQDLDVEHAVRERMLMDISRMAEMRGPSDAILVVGDIAGRGKSAEYEIAQEFLNNVSELAGCPSDRVVCVPGNHDVDRASLDVMHEALRQQLRTVEPRLASDKLLGLLRDETAGEVLLRPFNAYNQFSLAYGCDFTQQNPRPPAKELDIAGRRLLIHGLNTAWISDGSEGPSPDDPQLVCGIFQLASVGSRADEVSMTLSHHPPRWLRDGQELHPWFASANLVLTGHEHETGIQLSADGRTLYVASGAVNPSRAEAGWIPAYNLLELDTTPDSDLLEVTVCSRAWQNSRAEFGANDAYPDPMQFQIRLRLEHAEPLGSAVTANVDQPSGGDPEVPPPQPIESSRHSHVFSVMRSAPDRRRRIAREMGLINHDLTGLDADREILRNAIQTQRLAELAARLVGDGHDG